MLQVSCMAAAGTAERGMYLRAPLRRLDCESNGGVMAGWWQASKRRFAELRRRRVLRALGAYVVVGWLLLQVADATFEPLGLPLWAQRALIIAVIAGIVPAAMLAWVFDLTRARPGAHRQGRAPPAPRLLDPARRRRPAATGRCDAGRPARAGARRPMSAIASIAVLPFTDLSQAHDHDWFCDGLAEEIIDSLCCVRGLRVASRTASFRFRDGSVDPREIGRLLNVDAILEGSVRVAGERLRVTAQLVDAGNGYHRWSETYERQVADVFAIQARDRRARRERAQA